MKFTNNFFIGGKHSFIESGSAPEINKELKPHEKECKAEDKRTDKPDRLLLKTVTFLIILIGFCATYLWLGPTMFEKLAEISASLF